MEPVPDKSETVIITRERLRFLAIGYYVRAFIILGSPPAIQEFSEVSQPA